MKSILKFCQRYMEVAILIASHFEIVFANQLFLSTGEAFYSEVSQPSQVELFLFHGVRKTK
jgi:hypothetical protein